MTFRLFSFAASLALIGLSTACGADKPSTSKTSTSSSPRRAASAAPSAQAAPPPRPAIDEAEFVETDRSRDPFRSYARSFVEEAKGSVRSQLEVVLSDYSLDELKLIGIVTRLQPAKAMLMDPSGKGHVIQRGQFVGRADVIRGTDRAGSTYQINWRVDRIREGDVVFVREDPKNPDVPTVTRVVPLRPEGTIEGR